MLKKAVVITHYHGCQCQEICSLFANKTCPFFALLIVVTTWCHIMGFCHDRRLFVHGRFPPQQPSSSFFFQAIAFSFNMQGRRMVEQPVQNSCCHHMIIKHLPPIQKTLVARHDQACTLVAPYYQAEKHACFLT